MAFGNAIRTLDGVPLSQGYLPGTGFVAAKSSPNTNTDASSNTSSALALALDQSLSLSATLQNAQGGNAAGTVLSVLGMASVVFTVNMAAYTGTVNFEGSEDGTNFDPLWANQLGTNTLAVTAVGSTTTSIHLYAASCAGLQSIRARTSGASAGSVTITAHAIPQTLETRVVNANQAGTWTVNQGGSPWGIANSGGTKATYVYAISATAPYATPTDWIVIRGSGTKTIKIVRVEISGAATAATEVIFTLKKHTIANTAGTSTTPTPMKHDSNDGAATATVLLYSAAPTIDATATIWKSVRMTLAVAPAATTNNPDRYVYDYADEVYEPLVLRGTAQEFAINFAGAAVPAGGVYDVSVTFTEE